MFSQPQAVVGPLEIVNKPDKHTGPWWYHTATSVPPGRNSPFSALRLLIQLTRKPPSCRPCSLFHQLLAEALDALQALLDVRHIGVRTNAFHFPSHWSPEPAPEPAQPQVPNPASWDRPRAGKRYTGRPSALRVPIQVVHCQPLTRPASERPHTPPGHCRCGARSSLPCDLCVPCG